MVLKTGNFNFWTLKQSATRRKSQASQKYRFQTPHQLIAYLKFKMACTTHMTRSMKVSSSLIHFLSGHEGFQSLGLDAVLRRILVEIFMARFEVFFEKMTMLLALAAADEQDVPCYGTKKELQ